MLRKISTLVGISLALLALSWGTVYASASNLLRLSPGDGATIASTRPLLSANFPSIPGVKITSLNVTLDGSANALVPPKTGTGFTFTPERELSQGEHVIRVQAVYAMGAPRNIDVTWRFTVDTEPPALSLKDGRTFFVTPVRDAEVPIKTESGAIVRARFNKRALALGAPGKDGMLGARLDVRKEKNELRLEAADKIGNTRSLTIPIILDETTPVVESFYPAEGEVVRQPSPELKAIFGEKESGLKIITLTVDGTRAVQKNDDGAKHVSYIGGLLGEGAHTAKVEAEDYAGHKVVKEWKFSVDTRRIVVNRGIRRLYFYKEGALQQTYGVAIGAAGFATPGGRWRIVNKQVNPRWINPGSAWAKDMPKVIPPGSSNPLGVRALALNARSILIHGTANYGSIGRAASHGCIRMRNSDIVNFFPLVDPGVPVDII